MLGDGFIGLISIHASKRDDIAVFKISIHASLAGGDTKCRVTVMARFSISIHASLAGGDIYVSCYLLSSSISIHASLAGGDAPLGLHAVRHHHFNPRLPRGRRPVATGYLIGQPVFQSTPPSREATAIAGVKIYPALFQSTPPSREATASAG